MSRLALGTVQFGLNYGISNIHGKNSLSEVSDLISLASSYQIKVLDTASGYGDSESILGAVNVTNFDVVSKLAPTGSGVDDIQEWVRIQFNESLSRMKLQRMYGYMLHRPADLLSAKGEDIYNALLELKNKGLVKKIGISIYSPDELDLILSKYNFDLVQAPFNVVDRRIAESGWMRRLKEMNIELHIRSVFLQGLLLMGREQIPPYFNRWSHLFNLWDEFLKKRGVFAHEACISFVKGYPEIDRNIVGVNNISQLKDVSLAFKSHQQHDFPDIGTNNEQLINPANWKN